MIGSLDPNARVACASLKPTHYMTSLHSHGSSCSWLQSSHLRRLRLLNFVLGLILKQSDPTEYPYDFS